MSRAFIGASLMKFVREATWAHKWHLKLELDDCALAELERDNATREWARTARDFARTITEAVTLGENPASLKQLFSTLSFPLETVLEDLERAGEALPELKSQFGRPPPESPLRIPSLKDRLGGRSKPAPVRARHLKCPSKTRV